MIYYIIGFTCNQKTWRIPKCYNSKTKLADFVNLGSIVQWWADLVLGNIGNALTKLRIPANLNNFTTLHTDIDKMRTICQKGGFWGQFVEKGGRSPYRRTLVHYGKTEYPYQSKPSQAKQTKSGQTKTKPTPKPKLDMSLEHHSPCFSSFNSIQCDLGKYIKNPIFH